MRAVMIDAYETPGEVRETADPRPGPREVVVDLGVAGVNPVDWKIRAGVQKIRDLPFVLGQDFAGRVAAVGDGVSAYAVGDRVAGIARNRHGGFAEKTLVALDQERLAFAPVPDDVSDEIAAALPTPALTALASLDLLALAAGSTVAIVGAAGALGSAALQLATRRDLRVVALVRSGQEAGARGFGAAAVVDTDGGDIAAQIRGLGLFEDGLDGVLDTVATSQEQLAVWQDLLKPGGVLVTPNHCADEKAFETAGRRAINVSMNETAASSREGLETLFAAIREGALTVAIGERGSLDDVVSLLDRGERHELHGKAVVVV